MRPKRFTKGISLLISEEQYQEIEELTNNKNISLGEWIREAIGDYINKIKTRESEEWKNPN
ncbi:hypothetical protein [Desulfoferula mesophila]|uniref:Ribbon-helix-helix protein CopG domain-containing protein n=1 Tax=Desulfoferula mesophila TaxID=3058419 RepID=A0AAU9EB88_9BACT|nr:hypothetical protein FAK_14820 [Desulfoferula mesophilus]